MGFSTPTVASKRAPKVHSSITFLFRQEQNITQTLVNLGHLFIGGPCLDVRSPKNDMFHMTDRPYIGPWRRLRAW